MEAARNDDDEVSQVLSDPILEAADTFRDLRRHTLSRARIPQLSSVARAQHIGSASHVMMRYNIVLLNMKPMSSNSLTVAILVVLRKSAKSRGEEK